MADDDTTPWLSDAEMQLWRRWLRVQTELPASLARAMHAETDLSMQDYETLVHLSEAEGERLRVSVLAEQMHWERSRLSHHLRRMETRALVAKENCPEDARGAFVRLTPAGKAALAKAAPAHVRAVRRLFLDAVKDTEIRSLDDFLARVLTNTQD